MPFYRLNKPGEEPLWAHINFGRKGGAARCTCPDFDHPEEVCGRMSVALCDAPAGETLSGQPLTCDRPLCELHRRRGEQPNTDYCPRHQRLAGQPPAQLELGMRGPE